MVKRIKKDNPKVVRRHHPHQDAPDYESYSLAAGEPNQSFRKERQEDSWKERGQQVDDGEG
jgi:hypothetical protein